MKSLCDQYFDVTELEGAPPTFPGLAVFLGFSTSHQLLAAAENEPPVETTDPDALHHLRQAITKLEEQLVGLSLTGVYNASVAKHALSAYHQISETRNISELTDRTLEIRWMAPPKQVTNNTSFLIQNNLHPQSLDTEKDKEKMKVVFDRGEESRKAVDQNLLEDLL